MQKIGSKLLYGVFAVVLLGAGCASTSPSTSNTTGSGDTGSKTASSGGCGSLKVTVDGQDISAKYTNGLAYTAVNGEYRTDMVQLYNGTKFNYTCEDVLGQGRIDSADLDMLGAFYHASAQGVNIESYNFYDSKVTSAPTKSGDNMTICVNTTFTPDSGTYAGKKVTMSGGFTGAYCGDKVQ